MDNNTDWQVNKVRTLIGKCVKEFRLKKGLTQEELAALLSVSKPTISKIESGRWLSLEMLIKLSVSLDFYIFLLNKDSHDDLGCDLM